MTLVGGDLCRQRDPSLSKDAPMIARIGRRSGLSGLALASLVLACRADSSGDEAATDTTEGEGEGDGGDEDSLPPLEPRPTTNTCTMQGTAAGALPRVSAEPIAELEPFVEAQQILADPDGDGLLVVEAGGRVWRVDEAGQREGEPWLDLASEVAGSPTRGLLALALAEGWVYAHFHRALTPQRTRVVRIPFAVASTTVDPSPALTMIEFDHGSAGVESGAVGGALAIDEQGNLLIGVGEGTSSPASAPASAPAQDRSDLRGSLLRITAPSEPIAGYTIPPDNPLLADPQARPEIYAIGLHDPRHLVIAADTTWVSDHGSGVREELDRVQAGGNLGWPITEGWACTGPGDCDPTSYLGPSFDYALAGTEHCQILAGAWVSGVEVPGLAGALVWADRCSGRIWGLDPTPSEGLASTEVLGRVGEGVAAIGTDAAGDPWLVDGQGRLARLGLAEHGLPGTLPDRLSESECFDPGDLGVPKPELIPYLVGAPLWSDGLAKQRWLVVPPDRQIEIDEQGRWQFPDGSVLIKTFSLESSQAAIETRFMVRRVGVWEFYSYRWRPDRSDADRLDEGQSVELDGFDWEFPSEVGCRNCHGFGEGEPLGPTTLQINRLVDYGGPAGPVEQLDALAGIGLFAADPGDPASLPRLVDPSDESASLDARARAYLHANCAHCHQPTWMRPDLRWTTSFADTETCGQPIEFASPEVGGELRIDPGQPENSNLWLRMGVRGEGQMPLLGSGRVDTLGLALIEAWIRDLDGCEG